MRAKQKVLRRKRKKATSDKRRRRMEKRRKEIRAKQRRRRQMKKNFTGGNLAENRIYGKGELPWQNVSSKIFVINSNLLRCSNSKLTRRCQ